MDKPTTIDFENVYGADDAITRKVALWRLATHWESMQQLLEKEIAATKPRQQHAAIINKYIEILGKYN